MKNLLAPRRSSDRSSIPTKIEEKTTTPRSCNFRRSYPRSLDSLSDRFLGQFLSLSFLPFLSFFSYTFVVFPLIISRSRNYFINDARDRSFLSFPIIFSYCTIVTIQYLMRYSSSLSSIVTTPSLSPIQFRLVPFFPSLFPLFHL